MTELYIVGPSVRRAYFTAKSDAAKVKAYWETELKEKIAALEKNVQGATFIAKSNKLTYAGQLHRLSVSLTARIAPASLIAPHIAFARSSLPLVCSAVVAVHSNATFFFDSAARSKLDRRKKVESFTRCMATASKSIDICKLKRGCRTMHA